MKVQIIEYYNKCKQHTSHKIKAHTVDIDDSEAEGNYILWGSKIYQILECTLCKDTFGRTREKQLFPYTHPLIETRCKSYEYSEEYHPPRLVNTLPVKQFGTMPSILENAYEEIIFCYNNSKLITCSSGIKVLLEGVCTFFLKDEDNVKDKSSLSELCLKIIDMSFLDGLKYSLKFTDFLTFKGMHNPDEQELRIVIELLEDLLARLFPNTPKSNDNA